jgi:YesN/AraC family two-component response regulator
MIKEGIDMQVSETTASSKTDKQCLLIIDDSDDVTDFLSELFSESYHCVVACDGIEGLQTANKIIPDIIICDVQMPRMNGLEVVRLLKSKRETRYIPTILLSGYNTRENRLEGLRAMADDFIAKPFDYEELNLKMSNLLQLRSEMMSSEPEDYITQKLDLDTSGYSSKDRELIEDMIEYFAIHYPENKLNIGEIAESLSYSVRQLQRKIKTITGLSPMDLLRIYRVKQAAAALLRHKTISEVSEASGFSSPNYFCTCFKDYYNITPRKYQRQGKDAI